jgi:DUF1009 family protein
VELVVVVVVVDVGAEVVVVMVADVVVEGAEGQGSLLNNMTDFPTKKHARVCFFNIDFYIYTLN